MREKEVEICRPIEVVSKSMKPPHSTTLAPVIASVVLLCSMGLFALAPVSARVWQVPESRNLICYSPKNYIGIPVNAFRNGSLLLGHESVSEKDLSARFGWYVANANEQDKRALLFIRMDPEIPMVHVRQIWEAANESGVDAIFYRVRQIVE